MTAPVSAIPASPAAARLAQVSAHHVPPGKLIFRLKAASPQRQAGRGIASTLAISGQDAR